MLVVNSVHAEKDVRHANKQTRAKTDIRNTTPSLAEPLKSEPYDIDKPNRNKNRQMSEQADKRADIRKDRRDRHRQEVAHSRTKDMQNTQKKKKQA